MKQCGVYIIKNTVNGRVYVGSSKNIQRRIEGHKYALKRNQHHAIKMQRAWNKYGPDAFVFEAALFCDEANRVMYEQAFITFYDSAKNGYNSSPTAGGMLGFRPNDKQRMNMKIASRRIKAKYEWKGQKRCLAEIAEMEQFPVDLLQDRVADRKETVEYALSRGRGKRNEKYTAAEKTLTAEQWAEFLHVNQSSFRNWLHKYGIEGAISRAKQITLFEVGSLFDLNANVFSERVKRGWSVGDAIATPVDKYKLTREKAQEIRQLYPSTSATALAQKYGVHKDTIYYVVNNKIWREKVSP